MQEVIGKYQALHSWQPRESLEALVKKNISVNTQGAALRRYREVTVCTRSWMGTQNEDRHRVKLGSSRTYC